MDMLRLGKEYIILVFLHGLKGAGLALIAAVLWARMSPSPGTPLATGRRDARCFFQRLIVCFVLFQ